MKHIIVCCAAACATSSLLEGEMNDLLASNNIDGKVTKCMFGEVVSLVANGDIDLIVIVSSNCGI